MVTSKEMNLSTQIANWPKKFLKIFIPIVIVFITLGALVQVYQYFFADYIAKFSHKDFNTLVEMFDLNQEANPPSWYSSFGLLLSSGLIAIIASIKSIHRDNYTFHWKIMSLVFLCLSIDELCSFHEILNYHFQGIIKSVGFLHFAWVVFGGVFVLLFVLFNLRFLFHLAPKTRNLFILAGTLYISGALIMEMIAGDYIYLHGSSVVTAMMSIFEEFLEMIGIVVFNYALISYIVEHIEDLQVSLVNPEAILLDSRSLITDKPEMNINLR